MAGWAELSWAELNWTELNWTELNWTELNWTELNWTELNWTELNWAEPRTNWRWSKGDRTCCFLKYWVSVTWLMGELDSSAVVGMQYSASPLVMWAGEWWKAERGERLIGWLIDWLFRLERMVLNLSDETDVIERMLVVRDLPSTG
jgi:hypothetical protein